MMQLTLNNLRYYWRTHVGVLLGVILSSAVLTGALLVGDSVRGSLRRQALERLGPYTHALEMPHALFSARLGELLDAEAVLRLDGMALNESGLQVNRVQVLGGILEPEADSGVLLNEALARALGVSEGDMVSLRLEKPGLLPRDAPLAAQRADAMVRGRFRVERILSGAELGNFSLRANQVAPYNAFVSRAWLADRMELAGRANLMVATGARVLAEGWVAEDFGLRFREHEGVVQLESERVYLEAEVARAAMSMEGAAGSLTYLVNSISCGERATPYSFVTAGGMTAEPGPSEGIVINEWLATELEAAVGDAVTLRYYELLPSNEYVERERSFEVTAVAAMEALTLEQALAPLFPGLTDVDRCAEWDAGFPLEAEALEDAANEAYWEQYRQTPKAIISLAEGQSIWSNRFGELTAVRWEGRELVEIRGAFQAAFRPEAAGFVFRPVRAEAEAAVEQALDFGQLFVGISFFLIVAALMLTGLLFVFGVQKRSEELGILMATGWRTKQIRRLVMREGSLVALAGSLAGGLLGIGYTELLIWGLSSEWSGAVAQASIACFVSVKTVLTGMGVSFLCANGAMLLSIRKGLKQEPRALLCGGGEEDVQVGGARGAALVAVLAVVGAGVLVAAALGGFFASVTIPFFGAGALLLIAGILGAGLGLRYAPQRGGLWGLALRNAMRRRGRSLAVIGLLASGCFMVFAVASMQEDLSLHAAERGSGTGGFAFYAESVCRFRMIWAACVCDFGRAMMPAV
jgi:putative ABC transport system permease protein